MNHRTSIIVLFVALCVSACTLSSSPANQTILTDVPTTVALDLPTRTPIPTSNTNELLSGSSTEPLEEVDTDINTNNTNSPVDNMVNTSNTTRDTQTVICNPQTGWNTYTVVAGDTLFGIAQRANATVYTLVSANCLVDAGLIDIGQVLYVPNPIESVPITNNQPNNTGNVSVPDTTSDNNNDGADTSDNDSNRYTTEVWWIVQGDGVNGFPVGCGDSLLSQQSGIPTDLGIQGKLVQGLQHLTDDNNIGVGIAERGWWNPMSQTNLTLDEISIAKTHLVLRLIGDVPRVSACADAQLEAQIALNAMALTNTRIATIFINEQNMRDYFSTAGEFNLRNYSWIDFQNGNGEVESTLIAYWVGAEIGSPDTDVVVGCETYLTPMQLDNPITGNLQQDVETALRALLDSNRWIPPIYTNLWKDQNLTVDDVTISDGHAEIEIGGQLMGGGVCSDPILVGQMIETIFQFDQIQSARVMNGTLNLQQLVDQSGLEDLTDYTYTRSN